MRKEKQVLNKAEALPTSKKEIKELWKVSVTENLCPLFVCGCCRLADANSAWPLKHTYYSWSWRILRTSALLCMGVCAAHKERDKPVWVAECRTSPPPHQGITLLTSSWFKNLGCLEVSRERHPWTKCPESSQERSIDLTCGLDIKISAYVTNRHEFAVRVKTVLSATFRLFISPYGLQCHCCGMVLVQGQYIYWYADIYVCRAN